MKVFEYILLLLITFFVSYIVAGIVVGYMVMISAGG